MKRIKSLMLLCCALPVLLVAQEAQEEKKVFIPEQGDFAISFDATPILSFVGNMFNGNQNNDALDNGFSGTPMVTDVFPTPTASVMGKYMITDRLGARINIGLLHKGVTTRTYVDNDAYRLGVHDDDVYGDRQLIDVQKTKTKGGSISFGPEWRVGKKRIQGVFGADLMFAFANRNTKNEWANAMTSANQTPTTSNGGWWQPSVRILEQRNDGYDFYTGVVGHVGVEFFVAPKIALGAEVNVSAYWQFANQEYLRTERFNTVTGVVEENIDLLSPKGLREFSFGTENLGGAFYMSFYF